MLIIVYISENYPYLLNKKITKSSKLSRTNVISITVLTGIIILVGIAILHSFSPVNSDSLVFAPPSNIFLKAVKSAQGSYHYMHTKGGKSLPTSAGNSPHISASKGNLVEIHLINEEKNQPGNPSKHNLNIDEFNVHTKDLGYFQSESITFLADKSGTFDYYCSIHPEMRGQITVS
ncbi:methyl-accepting chemotaxis protein [Candidatus Nitrosopumilus koreensis AR1]|uniref:Methyl-accepting chemotaxis protein n=1 Tax=Candidatus Nitrosopumilus koreensis AR1 TaxID=1229908 RepID=K0B9T2_9ARCH|nr:methyl-accepting chemotaxis protein [Candidatus Nitrosopumilus koreensis AR1]